ncbi:MAG TPA: dihydrofolate reductase [Paludibacteraceae bacterium]|nr:dihydrofolate reductase [Paludibacteraceae bacterium]HPT42696.1 dihydrofolate reductase [Paludibacteraceae bacterium]
MKKLILFLMISSLIACGGNKQKENATPSVEDFNYSVDKFADVEILRYRVPGFEKLSLKQKEMIYYLSQAAIEGRDILYDQNNKYNLSIRRILEAVYENYKGDRDAEPFKQLTTYLKRVWMANGIHHHYSEDKFTPAFSTSYFAETVKSIDPAKLPLQQGETVDQLIARISPVIFDPTVYPKRTNQADGVDLILTSANNYYEGVTQQEAEDFYTKMKNPRDSTPISYGLNSKLMKENGKIVEKTYKIGGMYSKALSRVVGWLEKAAEVAENDKQRDIINTLIRFNQTGDLKTFDEYCIKWVQDLTSQVDFVNGFTETYADPLGLKASWESIVNFKNIEATKRTEIISSNAQWFEDNSPVDKNFKKEKVKGVSAKVITVAMLGGDCYPPTPIGINLPNANWIRAEYGSKSVTIENITEAYDQVAMGNGFNEEFMWSDEERNRAKEYASLTNNLHTDLHECLGHGSGKLLPGTDPNALKAYDSTIEEARADLFGLYYIGDPKLVELGLLPNNEAFKAEYYQFLMNGMMTQLTRIKPGKNIEEAHMRNRQLIANWVYENGKAEKVVEFRVRDGKSFVVVNDYNKVRILFGKLLAEIQRIKSTGDFNGGRDLVEKYAVKVNSDLHKEVLARYEKLNLAPYKGFVNPVYTLVTDKKGKIKDVTVSYTENYVDQNLRYSREYSKLPNYN